MPAGKRILLSRMKYIGDVVLTTPLIAALRAKFPDAYIAYLGEKEAVSLLQGNPDLNEIIPFDFTKPAILEQPRVMWRIRRKKFDVFVDLFCNPRTAMIARASGAAMRVGKEVAGRGALYTHTIRDDGKPKSAVDFHYQYLRPLGVDGGPHRTAICITEGEKQEARRYLSWQEIDPALPIVGLHPGATWPAKMWEWEKFADLIDLLRAKAGVQVVVTQGPRDGGIVEKISRRSSGSFRALPVMPLRQLAAILSLCSVYAANDNGTMHMSAAVGTPTIGIFGPGEDDIWFPYTAEWYGADSKHIALRKDVSCHPCHLDFCNRESEGYMECMKLLTVHDVFSAIKSRLIG